MKCVIAIFAAVLISTVLVGCGHKKIVVKNCDKAANSDVYVCDPL